MLRLVCALVLAAPGAGDAPLRPANAVEVPAMLIKLIEQVVVPAREAGVLAAVSVREGEMVQEGQVLAQIEDTEARILQERTRIELEIARLNAQNDVNTRFAKKSVEVARAELRRSAESNQRYPKSISESEMDRLRLLVDKSALEVEQADHEFKVAGFTSKIKENEHLAAQEKLRRHQILAPLAGVVVEVSKHRGEWVNPGDRVVRILRLDRLRAEGFLKAQHLVPKLEDRDVKLSVDLPGQPGAELPAKVVFVDPEIDPVNSQVRIWAEVENRDLRLRPGMRATMTLTLP